MKCSEFLNELTNYLDGALDARTKSELDEHLAWCHNCYVVCDTTRKTIEIYRNSELYELPDDLRTRLRVGHHEQMCGAQEVGPASAVERSLASAHAAVLFVSRPFLLLNLRKCLIPRSGNASTPLLPVANLFLPTGI